MKENILVMVNMTSMSNTIQFQILTVGIRDRVLVGAGHEHVVFPQLHDGLVMREQIGVGPLVTLQG